MEYKISNVRKDGRNMKELISQKMRTLAPESDPLRIGTGWKPQDLSKPQIIIESTFGDSHPGSGHLNQLVEDRKSTRLNSSHIH